MFKHQNVKAEPTSDKDIRKYQLAGIVIITAYALQGGILRSKTVKLPICFLTGRGQVLQLVFVY